MWSAGKLLLLVGGLFLTYVVLAGTTMVYVIKNPYKRMAFYTIVIISGWYARVSSPSLTPFHTNPL